MFLKVCGSLIHDKKWVDYTNAVHFLVRFLLQVSHRDRFDCDAGNSDGMLKSVSRDIAITGKSPFPAQNRGENDGEKFLTKIPKLKLGVSSVGETNRSEKPEVKLPVLAKKGTVNSLYEDSNDLQFILRVRCLEFPLRVHGLRPELDGWSTNSPVSTTGEGPNEATSEASESDLYTLPKEKNNSMSLSSFTVLEGRRMNLLGKEDFKKQERKKQEENNDFDSDSESSQSWNMSSSRACQQLSKPPKTDKFQVRNKCRVTPRNLTERKMGKLPSGSDMIKSICPRKDHRRPSLKLPKADKYDFNPPTVVEVKVCSVFKGDALKTMIIYPGYSDSWIPRRDRDVIKNAVFKAIMQRPALLLRQPLQQAGMTMVLKDNKTSAPTKANMTASPPVDTELTRQVKKFVVRLPPIGQAS